MPAVAGDEKKKIEYRVWNPFRSKLAACILGGVDAIHMPPGSKVNKRIMNKGLKPYIGFTRLKLNLPISIAV